MDVLDSVKMLPTNHVLQFKAIEMYLYDWFVMIINFDHCCFLFSFNHSYFFHSSYIISYINYSMYLS